MADKKGKNAASAPPASADDFAGRARFVQEKS
jgi:hypothetical protein